MCVLSLVGCLDACACDKCLSWIVFFYECDVLWSDAHNDIGSSNKVD